MDIKRKSPFIEEVNIKVGDSKVITSNSELAPAYTKKQLLEEQKQETFSIFNIPETFRQISKRSNDLYAFIDNWYGTPYRLGGTSRRGIDCSAFMQEIYGNVL
ncbi:MAG: C40 family peptidase [Taibaiella sp.]|nr:C40 family peptidase [Taibaiella sp.]